MDKKVFHSWPFWLSVGFGVPLLLIAMNALAGLNQDSGSPANESSVISASDYPLIAGDLAGQINDLSPTPAFDEVGWIAKKISFIPGNNMAYIEYTDTHLAMRLLLEYHYRDNQVSKATVLGTFLPTEQGQWSLDQGSDKAQGSATINYIYKGDSKQWIPEQVSN